MKQKYYIDHLFNKWLKKNIDRFSYKPVKVKRHTYRFKGIIDDITLIFNAKGMSFYEATILYTKNNEYVDMQDLGSLWKVKYDKKRKKYYDYYYIKPIYYNSIEDLVYNEVFETILEYSNKTLLNSKYLYYTCYANDNFILTTAYVRKTDYSKLKPHKLLIDKSIKFDYSIYKKYILVDNL